MSRLIITADVHGSISTWSMIKELLNGDDSLAVAGDLFDTVYGSSKDPDFQPEIIKKEFKALACDKYYVYGNCDSPAFYQGQKKQLSFEFDGFRFFLNHGHLNLPDLSEFDIIIEGHSHIAKINEIMGKVFLNPGSPVLPRKNSPSYAVFENKTIKIIDAVYGQTIFSFKL